MRATAPNQREPAQECVSGKMIGSPGTPVGPNKFGSSWYREVTKPTPSLGGRGKSEGGGYGGGRVGILDATLCATGLLGEENGCKNHPFSRCVSSGMGYKPPKYPLVKVVCEGCTGYQF